MEEGAITSLSSEYPRSKNKPFIPPGIVHRAYSNALWRRGMDKLIIAQIDAWMGDEFVGIVWSDEENQVATLQLR